MEALSIVCSKCSTRLKIPNTTAAGKKVKCPKCSQLNVVPAPAAPRAAAVTPKAAPAQVSAASEYEVVDDKPATLQPAQKPCPYCGEMVLANAVKCRHCGEFFDVQAATKVRRERETAGSTDSLNPAEYLVALVFSPVGLVIGIIWKLKNLGKAMEMLKISGLAFVIFSAVVASLTYFYVIEPRMRPPVAVAAPGFGPPGYMPVPGIQPYEEDGQPEFTPTGPPPDMPPDLADLDQQPAPIRRALKANVRIAQQSGVGSGVILRKDGGKALILTNRHVVDLAFAQTRGMLQVALSKLPEPTITYVTRDEQKGKVVWLAEDEVDLAVVEAACPDNVEAVPWQTKDEVTIGEQVFAVGNPAGLGWTFTRGVISALRQHEYGTRKVPVVQTDTRIGPGNSGGGLYNQNGELIGINTFVVGSSPGSAGETGLGFAIRKHVLLEMKPDIVQIPSETTSP